MDVVNNSDQAGQIAGEAFDPDFTINRAVLWASHSSPATDLNTVIPPGLGVVLTRAVAINNAGVIVGDATIGGHTHGFVLSPNGTPTPTPTPPPHHTPPPHATPTPHHSS